MLLKQLFMNESVDFEKKCKCRIMVGILFAVLGLLAIIAVLAADSMSFVNLGSGVRGFYSGTGGGVLAAGIAIAIRSLQILKNPELKKKREIWESDERNRMLGLRCWSYAGYTMFVLLYIVMLIAGFISETVLLVLQAVIIMFALLLLIFRLILKRIM